MSSNNTDKSKARRASKVKALMVAVAAAMAGVVGLANPAGAAAVQVYQSTPVNGMWHSGNTQYYNGNTNFTYNVYFNDAPGDAYCTLLRVKAYGSNGGVVQFNRGSVCGGRAATLGDTLTAYPGSTLTKIEIWTVRADGGARSYLWDFRP